MSKRAKAVPTAFKCRHFSPDIILLCVRWYLTYRLSYRDLVEMMDERGVKIAHTTILRWVIKVSFELKYRAKPFMTRRYKSWRMDETYIKVKGEWKYLFRAVDKNGAYTMAKRQLEKENKWPPHLILRQNKYLNNMI